MLALVNQFLSWTQKKETLQTVTIKVRVSHSSLFIVLNKREVVLTIAVSPT